MLNLAQATLYRCSPCAFTDNARWNMSAKAPASPILTRHISQLPIGVLLLAYLTWRHISQIRKAASRNSLPNKRDWIYVLNLCRAPRRSVLCVVTVSCISGARVLVPCAAGHHAFRKQDWLSVLNVIEHAGGEAAKTCACVCRTLLNMGRCLGGSMEGSLYKERQVKAITGFAFLDTPIAYPLNRLLHPTTSTMPVIRASVVQASTVASGNAFSLSETLAKLKRLAKVAKDDGAQLVVFPEAL
jgi:hypothetical protein